jgi:non-specific serine/threonine protein kinase
LAALLTKSRLVTLQGTGGMGKTRLSLEIAADSLDAFPDGVWLVELAAPNDSRLVPRTVASVLGVSEKADQPLVETLAEAIGDRRSLIVLDNCEHVINACAGMASTFLRRTSGLRIIATSREALCVDGEQVYLVSSLSMPARGDSVDEVMRSDAAQLLVDRASLQLSGWTPSARQAQAISDICKRLDGLPLALELAAARMATTPIEHLADRLDNRFRLLVGGPRTVLPR